MNKRTLRVVSSNPRDYPASMAGYERDSLVAEAILTAEKKNKRRPKTAKNAAGRKRN